MKFEEIFLLAVGGGIFLKFVILDNAQVILKSIMYLVISIALISIIPLTIYFHNKHLKKVKETEEYRVKLNKKEEAVKKLLKRDLEYIDSRQLKEFIKQLEDSSPPNYYKNRVNEKLEKARIKLKEVKQEEKLFEIRKKQFEREARIKELDQEILEKERKLRLDKVSILEHLEAESHPVFLMEDLTKKEIKALQEDGYKKVNEYDPLLQENANFLHKKVLNHSPTHTILVERVKEMLLQYLDYNEVSVRDTKEADIIFKINGKKYAFEIETGSLLSKKDQLRDKLEYLNRRYKKNWYFIVSNKHLLSKYRKYGKSTPRSGVKRIIEKLMDF